MKVTVCELSDNEIQFVEDWSRLKTHISTYKPYLLLLPEMPFCKWIASAKEVDEGTKIRSIEKHDRWMKEIEQLKVACTVYSRPEMEGGKFYNSAYVYTKDAGHVKMHTKCLFPEEEHFWEASWYDAGAGTFDVIQIGDIKIGVLLCTEMWFTEHARHYGKQGADILLCPRATGFESANQWIRCGQTLAVISGAYCLSANRSGRGDNDFQWGGNGWIAKPMTGNLIGTTSADQKFLTAEIDLSKSREAKGEYPLYVKSGFES